MGKLPICICENKGADQLRSNFEADQRLCFRCTDSTIFFSSKIRNFKLVACICACTGRFVSDLLGNHIVGFPTRRLKYTLTSQFWISVVCFSWTCFPHDRKPKIMACRALRTRLKFFLPRTMPGLLFISL